MQPCRKLLGHIIQKEGIMVDPGKTKVIKDLQPPISLSKAKFFLGYTRYQRKFVKAYAKYAT